MNPYRALSEAHQGCEASWGCTALATHEVEIDLSSMPVCLRCAEHIVSDSGPDAIVRCLAKASALNKGKGEP